MITVGDRFETMATALAATYMNIPLAHTMGGEVSGNIDESIRHAVTKFAHIHFPASQGAAERIVRLGEDPESVHVVGCPRMDLVAEVLREPAANGLSDLFATGVGGTLRLDEPFLLVSQHPVTTEYGDGKRQITETLEAVQELGRARDRALAERRRGLRAHRRAGSASSASTTTTRSLHFFKNLPTSDYIKLMATTACLVGNS